VVSNLFHVRENKDYTWHISCIQIAVTSGYKKITKKGKLTEVVKVNNITYSHLYFYQ